MNNTSNNNVGLLGMIKLEFGTDRPRSSIYRSIQWRKRMGMGVECDRRWGQLWDIDITNGGDVGSSSLHVCHRTVKCCSSLVCSDPP